MFGTQTFFSTPSLFMEVGGQRNITNIYSDNSNTTSFFIPIKSPFPLEKILVFILYILAGFKVYVYVGMKSKMS